MAQKLYIVVGSSGEDNYTDYKIWNICCYSDRGHAVEHATRAFTRQKEERRRLKIREGEYLQVDNPYDRTGNCDGCCGDECSYTVEEITLYYHLDQMLEEIGQ